MEAGGSVYEGNVSAGDLCMASMVELVGTLVFLHVWGPYVFGNRLASCAVSLDQVSYEFQESSLRWEKSSTTFLVDEKKTKVVRT